MIKLYEIPSRELPEYVSAAYENDNELFEKYHVAKYGFKEAVEETVRMIEVTANLPDVEMRYFGVKEEDVKIGYLCVFQHNLYSFGIAIDKRNKEVLFAFWQAILEVIGESFITMLYPNNTRAIGWVKGCGMQEVENVEDNCVVLINV